MSHRITSESLHGKPPRVTTTPSLCVNNRWCPGVVEAITCSDAILFYLTTCMTLYSDRFAWRQAIHRSPLFQSSVILRPMHFTENRPVNTMARGMHATHCAARDDFRKYLFFNKFSTMNMNKNMQRTPLPNDHLEDLKTSTSYVTPRYDKPVAQRGIISFIKITRWLGKTQMFSYNETSIFSFLHDS
jgi:hypothetical protein